MIRAVDKDNFSFSTSPAWWISTVYEHLQVVKIMEPEAGGSSWHYLQQSLGQVLKNTLCESLSTPRTLGMDKCQAHCTFLLCPCSFGQLCFGHSPFAHKVVLLHILRSTHCILGETALGRKGKWNKTDMGVAGNICWRYPIAIVHFQAWDLFFSPLQGFF